MRIKNPVAACFALACLLLPCHSVSAENWTRFRGENGQGHSSEKNLPLNWSPTENVRWKTAIPGGGWSSPIVYEDRVFVTTASEEGASCRILCIERKGGQILWDREVHRQVPGPKRAQNSYATPTPVTDGERVYAVFSDGAVVAVDFKGELIWKNTEIDFHSLHGLGASPILVNDQLVMPFDGSSREEATVGWKQPWDQAVVMAFDKLTGEARWNGKRGLSRVGHVTPIVAEAGSQIISAGGDRVQGFDVASGERLWSIYSQGEGVTPSPVIGNGVLFTSSGFEDPTIRAIRLGGRGDVTDTHIVWEQRRGVPVLASPLLVSPFLYTISRENILHCIEETTGDVVWLKRLEGNYSASPVYADGRIYVLSEDGLTLVLQPGDEYKEITRNSLDEKCLASMAVSDGQFFIRGVEQLYCIANAR